MTINMTEEISMTKEQLWNAVVTRQERVYAPQIIVGMYHACLEYFPLDGQIHMWGETGRHSLNLSFTDADRLWTHWQGFKEVNASRLKGKSK